MGHARRSWLLATVAAATSVGLTLGCGGGSGGGGGGGGGAFGLTSRVPVTTLTFPLAVPTPGTVQATEAFPSLPALASPVFVTAAPGDANHLFVIEQIGRIRVFDTRAPTSYSTFLDITSRVTNAMGEEGLLGLAFHPQYATNGQFFVNYIAAGSTPRSSVIARYTVSSNPLVANTSETRLLTLTQPYTNHNAGMLAFGPDGYLYASFGDGGSGGDPEGHAQNLADLLGKLLRIDVDHGSPYAIPATNPFASSTGTERKEIFAWGLRNPWRFSFDRTSGRLWLADVGQGTWEEIDVVRNGGNYGWKAMEGNHVYSSPDLSHGPFDAPLYEYDHSIGGNCIIGGYVYRGSAVPSLYGAYLYSDNGGGQVWALSSDGTTVSANVQLDTVSEPSSFGEDAAGEVYLCEHGTGRLKRLVASGGGGGGTFPQTLSATGIFSDVATLSPSPGLVPYGVNVPLWSDGALKDRLLALPGTERIGWSEDGAWTFPTGTVLVKTFRLPLTAGDASSAVRVETRVLLSTTGGWEGYVYKWRDDQSDADLIPGADTKAYTIADASAPGGSRQQTWSFPSRSDCLRCHTAAAGRVLGLSTRQINGSFDYGGTTDNQLRAWDHINLFDVTLPAAALLPAHPRPQDTSQPVAARARAYLDANCSMCHRPGGPSAASIDLRAGISVAAMNVVGASPQFGNVGLASPQIVFSGDRSRSTLWARLRVLTTDRMPPLASSVVDISGSDLVGQWIDAGP